MATAGRTLDISALENWLWDAACVIRGAVDAPKYKGYILPLVFLKRLSDVFDDELSDLGTTAKFVDSDHSLVRFFVPPQSRWPYLKDKTTNLGELLTDAVRAVARENPKLHGVIDVKDFNETAAGQRILSDDQLHALIQKLSEYRLGLKDVEPDILGRAYEYLLRKFSEGQGQSGGEFYTPREVGVLMARILDPEPGNAIYDPTCGSGGLLIKCHLRFKEKYGKAASVAPLRFCGQEREADTFAMSRMNVFLHDMEAEIAPGDTMTRPAFLNAAGGLRQFDRVTANPMWNQKFPQTLYEHDTYSRFTFGIPPTSSADWGWVQHMSASLNENGRMAVVLDTGSLSRGSGNSGSNKEREIRKEFVERDWIEAVILLPENLFYNTNSAGTILVLNKRKGKNGSVLVVNGSQHFSKGKPKNFLRLEDIERLATAYERWESVEKFCRVLTVEELISNDCNLSPSRYIDLGHQSEVLSLDEAVILLAEAEEERAVTDKALHQLFLTLGIESPYGD